MQRVARAVARNQLAGRDGEGQGQGRSDRVGHTNDHAKTYGGKPWRYVLIPHDALLENVTLAGLTGRFAQNAIVEASVPT